ncbi:hypothetical protein K1719_001114 [Acacia pycnantha]|nr:hypothetical protein K1719_001114 [Acacia pycnantha]
MEVLVAWYCYHLWKKKKSNDLLKQNFGEESSSLKSMRYSLSAIETATKKFSQANKIGKGGFGEVYKGILPNGQEVAVKRLSKSSQQGALEFKNEVLLISKLQHKNLVALIGFCLENHEKILIYEYVSNKSIDYFLFGSQEQKISCWLQRCKIIRGIAQGLLYLHEHSRFKIIHRDLKPSNILFDNNMNPKISDFGAARLYTTDQNQEGTSKIMGTHGYMAPEYVMYGKYSEKSDIFSFGVMILEIISGKRNSSSSEPHLLSHAWKQWQDGTALKIVDPRLRTGSYSENEIIKCIQIGLLCVQANPDDRPTMATVVFYLNNLWIELQNPKEPAFFFTHGSRREEEPNMNADSYWVQSSMIEMSNTNSLPR